MRRSKFSFLFFSSSSFGDAFLPLSRVWLCGGFDYRVLGGLTRL